MKTLLFPLLVSTIASTASADFINGTFDTDSDWTKVNTVAIADGLVTMGAGGNNRGAVYQTITTVAGDWYKITYDKGHAGNNNPSGVMVTAFDGVGNANADAYWGQSYLGQDASNVTAWFQAQGVSTTIQFRDFNYIGPSHDVRIDNAAVVTGTVGPKDEVNVANTAALSQSSVLNTGRYPASAGVDGVANNFMHGAAGDGASTYTMDFTSDQHITRVAVSAREGYNNRVGDTIKYYDASNTLLETHTVTDGLYNNLEAQDGYITGVRKIVVQEDPLASEPLNFAEIEVFTAELVNVAPLGTASASSVHGSFGADPARAIDESDVFNDSAFVFHSGGSDDNWTVVLEKGYTLQLVEIQARTGYNDRIGNTLEFLGADGSTLFTEAITDAALFSLAGSWEGVFGVRISESGTTLNLAEVRLFADTSVAALSAVPEPATLALVMLGGMALRLRRRLRK